MKICWFIRHNETGDFYRGTNRNGDLLFTSTVEEAMRFESLESAENWESQYPLPAFRNTRIQALPLQRPLATETNGPYLNEQPCRKCKACHFRFVGFHDNCPTCGARHTEQSEQLRCTNCGHLRMAGYGCPTCGHLLKWPLQITRP